MRGLDELLSDDDAWPSIADAIDAAPDTVVVLAPNDRDGRCLQALQVTTRSVLGAMAFHTGGLLVDHGWMRFYGAGSAGLPSLASANAMPAAAPPPVLEIGVDVLGGRFAVNGGGLPGDAGEVNWWAPDTLSWEPLGIGHGDFMHWVIGGGAAESYDAMRWPGWEAEVEGVGLDEGLMLYPPPCTREGRDPSQSSRRRVPRSELDHWLRELSDVPDGKVEIRVDP